MKRKRGLKYGKLVDTPAKKRLRADVESKMQKLLNLSNKKLNTSAESAEISKIINSIGSNGNNFLAQIVAQEISVNCKKLYANTIRYLLELCSVEYLNSRNIKGDTALHCTARMSSRNAKFFIELLLESKFIDYKTVNDEGDTFLHVLAHQNRVEITKKMIEKFLECSGDLNVQNCNGDTILHLASDHTIYGNRFFCFENTKLLIKHGAKYNIKNNKFYTPFQCAVLQNKRNIIKFYVQIGADIREDLDYLLNSDATNQPTKDWIERMKLLNALYILRNDFLDIAQFEIQFKKGYASLIIAILCSKSDQRYLLHKYDDALYYHYLNIELKPRILRLIDKINLFHCRGDNEKEALIPKDFKIKSYRDFIPFITQLSQQCKRYTTTNTETILSLIANLNQNNKWGNIASHVTKLLIENYKDCNAEGIFARKVEDALCNSCRNGNAPVCTTILQAVPLGENANDCWKFFTKALHIAIRFSNECLVSILIQHGAKVERLNVGGNNALHLAVYFSLENAVSAILKANNSIALATDKFGRTPYQIALDLGKQRIMNLIASAEKMQSAKYDAMEL